MLGKKHIHMITYCYTFIRSIDILCYSPYFSFMVQMDSRIGQLHVSYQLLEVNMENKWRKQLGEGSSDSCFFPFFAMSSLPHGLKMKSWICKLCDQRPNFPDVFTIPIYTTSFIHVPVFLWTCSFYINFRPIPNTIYC